MKKLLVYLVLVYAMISAALGYILASWADTGSVPLQNITLRDGTVLKGQLIEVRGDLYVIQTNQLGLINVKAAEILGIAPATAAVTTPAELPQTMGAVPTTINPLSNSPQGQMAQQFLQDPEISATMQELMKDPEIMNLLKDPSIMAAALSGNPEQIQNNEGVKALMQNPKMQELMSKMAQKMHLPSTP
jgi:hypothetical protein